MGLIKEKFMKLDFFGSHFQFSIFGSNKYKSIVGLLASNCCLIMIIVTTILFGKDFYNKESPKIVTENIKTENSEEISLSQKNLTLAFRIEDDSGSLAHDALDFINTRIRYNRYVYNETNQEFDDYSYDLNNVNCDENLVPDKKLNEGRNLSEYTCLNFPKDGFHFGGSWSGKSVSFFSIELSSCDKDDNNCSDINKVKSFLLESSTYYFFSLYYPTYYFLPNNLASPQNIKYNIYYTQLVPSLSKIDRVYFKSYLLDDDIGWIFKNSQSTSILAFDRIEKEFEINDFTSHKNNYYFYTIVLYFNSDYDKIYRSYIKIQELSALVGGFMKIIIFITELLIVPYNKFLMRVSLINQFYDCSSKKESEIVKVNVSNSFRPLGKDEMIKTNKEDIDQVNQVNDNTKNIVISNNYVKSYPNSNKKVIPSFMKRIDFPSKDVPNELSFCLKKVLKKTLALRNEIKFDINYLQFLLNSLFKSKNIKVQEFTVANDLLNKKMDVATYLETTKQFEILKHLSLNHYQNLGLSFIKNPDVNNKKDVELADLILFKNQNQNDNNYLTSNFNDMLCYFKNNKKNHNLSEIDLKLINNLPNPINKHIID